MAQNFEALFRALNLQPPIPLPSYEGADHEDPQRFVRQCEEYFAHTHTPPASHTRTAATGLRGDAERWWSCYSPLDFDWERFQELLYNRYNSPAVISRLNAQLFSRKQTEREAVGIYLQQKYLLYQCLRDTDPEPTKVCTLLELLRPSFRMAIRPSNPQTLAALMTRAMEAEYDLEDPQQGTRPLAHSRSSPMLALSREALPQGLPRPRTETGRPGQEPPGKRGTGGRGPEPCRQPELGLTENVGKVQGLPHILVTLGRSQVYAAVDCFASDCFISSKLVPEDHLIEGSPSTAKLAGEQTTMPLIGKTTITIHISDNPIQITAWVATSVREPLILGYPWLLEQNTIFELSSGTLYLGINKRFLVRIVNAPVPSTKPTLIRLEDLQQELPPRQQEKFLQLIQRFAKIFEQPGKLCQTQTTEHTIVLTTDKPTRERPYQYSESKRAIIRSQVQDMLENGIIESSSSPYNSPIVIAKKKDGRDRFGVNYKKLNSITEDVVQPIPKIQELLKDIGTATIFSTIDLKSGYWQIPMDRACKRYRPLRRQREEPTSSG